MRVQKLGVDSRVAARLSFVYQAPDECGPDRANLRDTRAPPMAATYQRFSLRPSRILLPLLLGCGIAAPAGAEWSSHGTPVATSLAIRGNLSVLPDLHGGHYLYWYQSAPLSYRLLHLDALGSAVANWPYEGIGVDQGSPDVDVQGVFEITYCTCYGIVCSYCSCLIESVLPDGTEQPGGAYVPAGLAATAGDGLGGWYQTDAVDEGCHYPTDIYAAHYDANAQLVWRVFLGKIFEGSGTRVWSVLSDGAGGAYCALNDGSVDRLTRLTSSGAAAVGWGIGGFPVFGNPSPLGGVLPFSAPSLVRLGTEGVLAGWLDESGIWFRHLSAKAPLVGALAPPTPVPGARPGDSPIGWTATGSIALLVWQRGSVLWAQSMDMTGQPQSGSDSGVVVCAAPGSRTVIGVRPAPGGGAIVVWMDSRAPNGTITRAYVQRLDAQGNRSPGWPVDGRAVVDTLVNQQEVAFDVDETGLTFAWLETPREQTVTGGERELYASRVTFDGAVPTLPAFVDWIRQRGSVRLRWFGAQGPPAMRVTRSQDGESWADIDRVSRNGLGYYNYSDATPRPGERWAYRLETLDGVKRTDVAWVTVPEAPALAIRGVEDAAGAGMLRVRVVLAENQPARLGIYDLLGRRMAVRALEASGEIERTIEVPLPETSTLLFLRLEQSGHVATRSVARIR